MEQIIRKVTYTKEFEDYFQTLSNDVKGKYDYVFQIMLTQKIVSKKFVKRIETTEFYEMRVSLGNSQYRSFLFAIDAENFMESHKIVLLNSFVEKSSKQYKAEIKKARKILKEWEEDL